MEVEKVYRPVPFWSWNEKLEVGETERQVEMMDEAGIGGYFMHARGGLQTPYMGEEWFDNVRTALEEGEKRGMTSWAYDENGWPSGFGNGVVSGKGVRYQQKYLRMGELEFEEPESGEGTGCIKNFIANCGGHYFYYEVNPFYVDVLDKEVVAEFIKTAYEPYYERYGNRIEGFFTDEPQISRNGIPWSFVFEDEYRRRYGEELTEVLEELFLPISGYRETRVKFWKMVTDLFSENYFKQIYDWCEEHGMKFTGHAVSEERLSSQITTNGACMPHYEYFHVPGMDWLGRKIKECLTARQVGSVAEQLGKKQVLSETFALCGHNVSFDELKGIFEWQMVRGINLLCPHLEGYSIRGIRKRDYPPAMYYQQPWWKEYRRFTDAMSLEGKILADGIKKVRVLLIHPQTTAWTLFDNGENKGLYELNRRFLDAIRELEEAHVQFHLGDETIMERHGHVEGKELVIGLQRYNCVINPCGTVLLSGTERLLNEYVNNGGNVYSAVADFICAYKSVDFSAMKDVIDSKDITYKKVVYDNKPVHFFVNSSANEVAARIGVHGRKLDLYSGELVSFTPNHVFEPWESMMIFEETEAEAATEVEADTTEIYLPECGKILEKSMNVLTLDYCRYYFDGVLQEENGYVLNICERANRLERMVHIRQEYTVEAEYVPDTLYLAVETPEIFKIEVNGKQVTYSKNEGRFEKTRKLDISGLMLPGRNQISFECDFEQSKEFYDCYRKAFIFESEKNRLTYDMEIEAVYLVGDFCVKTDGRWSALEREASKYEGSFVLSKPEDNIKLSHIEQQGYPFFAGQMTIEVEIDVPKGKSALRVNRHGVNVFKIQVGEKERTIIDSNLVDLSDFGVSGRTVAKITLINNLRNMLGPHHLKEGECYDVGPNCFYKEPCVWNNSPEERWDDGYCFVSTGI